jgi:bifunctional DNA-binding transcriptional regulator/antitoxin component of YhaV-PrlF toxin-antitoxin module
VDVKIRKDEDCPDSFSFTAVLDDRGRISIPASVRKKLKIDYGSVIITKVKSLKRRIKK